MARQGVEGPAASNGIGDRSPTSGDVVIARQPSRWHNCVQSWRLVLKTCYKVLLCTLSEIRQLLFARYVYIVKFFE